MSFHAAAPSPWYQGHLRWATPADALGGSLGLLIGRRQSLAPNRVGHTDKVFATTFFSGKRPVWRGISVSDRGAM